MLCKSIVLRRRGRRRRGKGQQRQQQQKLVGSVRDESQLLFLSSITYQLDVRYNSSSVGIARTKKKHRSGGFPVDQGDAGIGVIEHNNTDRNKDGKKRRKASDGNSNRYNNTNGNRFFTQSANVVSGVLFTFLDLADHCCLARDMYLDQHLD